MTAQIVENKSAVAGLEKRLDRMDNKMDDIVGLLHAQDMRLAEVVAKSMKTTLENGGGEALVVGVSRAITTAVSEALAAKSKPQASLAGITFRDAVIGVLAASAAIVGAAMAYTGGAP